MSDDVDAGRDRAVVYQRRLEEMTYVLHASGRRNLALAAAATAGRLARGDDTTPFVTELLQRSVAALMAEDETKARARLQGLPGPGHVPGMARPYEP